MDKIPKPIFHKYLSRISWKKIYTREYGVQYSEMAILCLSPLAKHHIPCPSVNQIVIPEENNSAFYIDSSSWNKLVDSLNFAYTTNLQRLEKYEKQFVKDGQNYLDFSRKLATLNLKALDNKKLCILYKDYQKKLFNYSLFAWTAFILNNYVSERATKILDKYIKKYNRESEKQMILNILLHPQKKAAVIALQEEVSKFQGKLNKNVFNHLYEKYKWLSCLDIHNQPWTKKEFRDHLDSFSYKPAKKDYKTFNHYAKQLHINKNDLEYLLMSQRFVYIKDARDDFRRQGVYFAHKLFEVIADRMAIKTADLSYLQESEVIAFFSGIRKISLPTINQRKKAFILYLDKYNYLTCLSGKIIPRALFKFGLCNNDESYRQLKGIVASKGNAQGKVVIVRGIKDLDKVKSGDILVAVTTHPDYVPAMHKASGIVTDEGGITSHAAIISREFSIPCIVGTKRATKILYDNDLVKLDTNKGLIIILKTAN